MCQICLIWSIHGSWHVSIAVVRVWFQNVTVETREGEGSVILSLRVSGELQRAVSVEINTRDGTAACEYGSKFGLFSKMISGH